MAPSRKSGELRSTRRHKNGAPSHSVIPGNQDVGTAAAAAYLNPLDLTTYGTVCREWREEAGRDELWQPFVTDLDTFDHLSKERIEQLGKQFSWRQLVQQLSCQRCEICHKATPFFFLLTCSRICRLCFYSSKKATMCTLSFATNHYLLSAAQAKALPTLKVEDHGKETGLGNAPVTLTLIEAACVSAIKRFGSQEGFEEEMAKRKIKAQVGYDAEMAAARAANADKYPSRPRILGLADETNFVGVNQQEYMAVRGPKYGHVPVVCKGFFETSGKRIFVEAKRHHDNGGELRKAIDDAPDGAMITLKGTFTLTEDLRIEKPLMLLGAPDGACIDCGHGEDAASLVVVMHYGVLRNIMVRRQLDWLDWGVDSDTEPPFGPTLQTATLWGVLLDGLTLGISDCGPGLLHIQGPILATNNTFLGSGPCYSFGFGNLVVKNMGEGEDDKATAILKGNDLTRIRVVGNDACFPQGDDAIQALNNCDRSPSWGGKRSCSLGGCEQQPPEKIA